MCGDPIASNQARNAIRNRVRCRVHSGRVRLKRRNLVPRLGIAVNADESPKISAGGSFRVAVDRGLRATVFTTCPWLSVMTNGAERRFGAMSNFGADAHDGTEMLTV